MTIVQCVLNDHHIVWIIPSVKPRRPAGPGGAAQKDHHKRLELTWLTTVQFPAITTIAMKCYESVVLGHLITRPTCFGVSTICLQGQQVHRGRHCNNSLCHSEPARAAGVRFYGFFLALLSTQSSPPTGNQTERAVEGKDTQCNSFKKNKLEQVCVWRKTVVILVDNARPRGSGQTVASRQPTRPGHPILPCVLI